MDKPKYIAEGFEEDATRLLGEFAELCSVEFSEFASVWRKNYFSLIFMGRPDRVETSEFTNEVFRISTHLLPSPLFYRKVGAVYLLYALYRNQIADPPIKIRIEMDQWKIIKNLQQEALLKKYRTLHFVIDYLISNAFMYVAHQTLKGPFTGSLQKITKSHDVISNLKPVYKSNLLEYSSQNNLQTLRDLHTAYLDVKKNLDSQVKVSLSTDNEVYNGFISDLNKLVNPKSRKEVGETLGNRRARIKAESFFRKATDRFGQHHEEPRSDNDDHDEEDTYESPRRRRSGRRIRPPKHERKVGRPSKKPKIEKVQEKSDDDNIDISHLIDQQNEFYLPPEEDCKKLRCKPGRFYYKVSPKREDSGSSDPDI